jgi:large subunit ribosomal protein L10e
MGLRPAKCYRSQKDRAYSRLAIKVHKKNYIGAVPGLRTRQFNMGNPLKKYDTIADLIVDDQNMQLRDNSLESVRLAVNRFLVNKVGKDNFFMKLRVYPHQVLRENKMATGAGADRVSQGMGNCPFGKPIGRAARVRMGQKIISVLINKEHASLAKQGLMRAKGRLSTRIRVELGEDIKSIGSLPKKTRIEKVEEKKEEKTETPAKEGEKKTEEKIETKTDKKIEKKKGKK